MPERLTTPFLARRAYRRRRLMDVARILPVIGAAGLLFPVLHATHDPASPLWFGGGLRLFLGIWLALVLANFGLGRALGPAVGLPDEAVGRDEADPPADRPHGWPVDPGLTAAPPQEEPR